MQAMFGVLPVNKPAGLTSRHVVSRIQRLLKPRKVRLGHTGTLDPMATGVLLVAVGRATRLVEISHEAMKGYEAVFELGCESDTLDSSGQITSLPDLPQPTHEQLLAACSAWTGTVEQVPPKFSAIHIDGQRAYDLARKGKEFSVPSRKVVIESLELTAFAPPHFELRVTCGTGTYIRTLGNDIAADCGSAAIMTQLNRTAVGSVNVEMCVELDALENAQDVERALLPARTMIDHVPTLELGPLELQRITNGMPITLDTPHERLAGLDADGELVTVLRRSGLQFRSLSVFRSVNDTPQPSSTSTPHKAES